MKQFLFFMASLLLVANSFSQKITTYSDAAVMKINNGNKFSYYDDINVEWNGDIDNIDNVKRVFFDTYSFTITEPFEILSEKIVDDKPRITFSSEAVDNMNNKYDVGLVKNSSNDFFFVFYKPDDDSNAICFMLTFSSSNKLSSNPKRF